LASGGVADLIALLLALGFSLWIAYKIVTDYGPQLFSALRKLWQSQSGTKENFQDWKDASYFFTTTVISVVMLYFGAKGVASLAGKLASLGGNATAAAEVTAAAAGETATVAQKAGAVGSALLNDRPGVLPRAAALRAANPGTSVPASVAAATAASARAASARALAQANDLKAKLTGTRAQTPPVVETGGHGGGTQGPQPAASVLDDPQHVRIQRDADGQVAAVHIHDAPLTEAFQLAQQARANQGALAHQVLAEHGIKGADVVTVVKGQHPDGSIPGDLADFQSGVREKFARKNSEGRPYDTLGAMTDMSRGRISVDSWAQVQEVALDMARSQKVKSITYPRDAPPSFVSKLKALCSAPCEMGPNLKDSSYPRIHIDVVDSGTGVVHEWQLGTKAYAALQQTHSIDVPPSVAAKLAKLDPNGMAGDKAYMHLVAYDFLAGLAKNPALAAKYGLTDFLAELNKTARSTNGWKTDAAGAPMTHVKTPAELSQWAGSILSHLAHDQPTIFDHLGH
jgi:uncharacterized OsmC-like protein